MTSSRRILIIDDSEVLLARSRRVLGAHGYDVVATTQIVGNARHLPTCQLVLIDYHMPGLNGSSVVESLRKVSRSIAHTCPFYVYTSDLAVATDYARLGFDGAFTDKGDDAALVRQVAAFFRLASMRLLQAAAQRR